MKAEELQIGDFVYYCKPESIHICSAQTFVNMAKNKLLRDLVKPIPITPEILKKNGFVYHPLFNECKEEEPRYALFFPMRDKRKGEDCIILSTQDEWNKDYKWGIDIEIVGHTYIQHELNYIHELQHILRLCKINKEIEL